MAKEPPIAANVPLPCDSYRWNKAIFSAFKKGIAANQSGLPLTSCPYRDKRKPDQRLTWSRAFVSAWANGWRWSDQQRGKPQADQCAEMDGNG
jgi:hypothetical protein